LYHPAFVGPTARRIEETGPMSVGEAWVGLEEDVVVVRLRGEPTEALLRSTHERVLRLAGETGGRVLYDALEMTAPPVDVPWSQRLLDDQLGTIRLKRAIVVPDTKLAYLARLAFGEGDYRVFYDDRTAAVRWLIDGD
jgi:hypothetical protein